MQKKHIQMIFQCLVDFTGAQTSYQILLYTAGKHEYKWFLPGCDILLKSDNSGLPPSNSDRDPMRGFILASENFVWLINSK